MTTLYSWCSRWISLFVLVAVLAYVTWNKPYTNSPPIRSDGEGYHIWTRAILDRDFSFRRYKKVQGIRLVDAQRQIYANQYPPGVALLRFPVMAFLVERHPGGPLISPAEHWANQILAGLALAIIGFACLRTCQLMGLPNWCGHVSLLALIFGTGLFHYATYDAGFSHVYSAMAAAVLCWLGVRAVVTPNGRLPIVATGLACFFFVLIRNTNALLFVAFLGAYFYALRRRGGLNWRGALRDCAVLLGSAVAATVVQLSYNYYAMGAFTLSSYKAGSFHFDNPMQRMVLFSYERGLFNYYPVVGLVLAAALAVRQTRLLGVWFALVVAAYTTLYGFWGSWALAQGFGHRGFVELMPVAVVVLAAAFGSMTRRARLPVVCAVIACTLLTARFMLGYWDESLPMEHIPASVYWSFVYGNNSVWLKMWGLASYYGHHLRHYVHQLRH